MCLGPTKNAQDFAGDRDQHLDPGPDFWIFHHCQIRQKKFVSTITDLPEIFSKA